MPRTHTTRRSAAVAAALLLAALQPAAAQERQKPFPLGNLVLAGYGSAQYTTLFQADELPDASANDFTASFSPVVLFEFDGDLLFEAELEFGLSGETTTTSLEYAQVDYLGFERVIITAGKFLMPFGLFSERLHPSWINKLPNTPLLYGHAHGGVADESLLPILADAGLMARYKGSLGRSGALDVTLFVTQGPRGVVAEEGEDAAHDLVPAYASADPDHDDGNGASAGPATPIAFGTSFSDNNKNKLLGARIGYVRPRIFEIYLSGFHAMYDESDYLDLYAGNIAAEIRLRSFELRGEGTLLWQELAGEDEYETVRRPGYYLQVSRLFGSLEPTVRWGQLLETELQGAVVQPERKRLAVGASYWIQPVVPLKLMYEWDSLDNDRLIVQWAFGF